MSAEDPPQGATERSVAPPWLSQLVHWQDEAIPIPGTNQRLGLDAIVGFFLPGAGDLASAAVSMLVVFSAIHRGVPVRILLLMVFNILFDAAAGSIPILGDLFDVAFRASSKNLALFERHGRTDPVSGGGGRFLRLVLLLCAITLTLLFISAMAWVAMGFVLGALAW